jgi:CheY-like chemotaxis protein
MNPHLGRARGQDRGTDRGADRWTPRTVPAPRLPPASVLAVADDPALRDLLLEIAVDEGYGVYCASGALEALAVLGRERPGVVLVDLDMANAKGLRFLDIFRQLRPHDEILCIAVTSAANVAMPAEVRVVVRSQMAALAEILAAHFAAFESRA